MAQCPLLDYIHHYLDFSVLFRKKSITITAVLISFQKVDFQKRDLSLNKFTSLHHNKRLSFHTRKLAYAEVH